MKRNLLCWLAIAMVTLLSGSLQAQNATITDDLSHEADNSAILDIKSSSKGLLIPRLTTEERIAIVEPAYGLMVFDNDENSFYFYNGTEWKDVSTNKDAWTQELETVFLRNNGAAVGIGTETPNAYVHIRMSEKMQKGGIPAFKIEDATGPITQMSSDSTVIYLNDTVSKANRHGTFTVTGRSTKGGNEYFKVSPNYAQFYFEPADVKGNKGGFAVGGITTPGKEGSVVEDYLNVSADSTVIAFYDTLPGKGEGGAFKIYALSGAKMNKADIIDIRPRKTRLSFKVDPGYTGGFEVVGYDGLKGGDSIYFQVDEDTTYINNSLSISGGLVLENVIAKNRIESPTFISETLGTNVLFDDTNKGVKGGFAVGGLSGMKAGDIYLSVEKDSTTIAFNDTVVKGVKGGFAVGGLSGTKGYTRYLDMDKYSTRVSFAPPIPGNKGGFAVGGLSGTKGGEDYLTIERDSTVIYYNDSDVKGVKGGFAVGGLSGTKKGYRPQFYFWVNKYYTRVNLATPIPGVKGGFAVGGLSGTKGDTTYFEVTNDTTYINNKLVINDGITTENLMSNNKIESPFFSSTGDSTVINFNDTVAKGIEGGLYVYGVSDAKKKRVKRFTVEKSSARVSLDQPAMGVKGGFAVGGLSGTKGDLDYLTVEQDSTRIYFDDSGTKGVKGGFAVGGLSGTKAGNQYFELDRYNARISLDLPAMGVKGGFAVGGLSGTKGDLDYLTVEQDSTRIYFDDSGTKGVKGGFAVGGLSGTKGVSYFAVGKDSTIFNNVVNFNEKVIVGNGLYSNDENIRATLKNGGFYVSSMPSENVMFSVHPLTTSVMNMFVVVGPATFNNGLEVNDLTANFATIVSQTVTGTSNFNIADISTLNVSGTANIDDASNNYTTTNFLVAHDNVTLGDASSDAITINGTTTAADVTATNVNITDILHLPSKVSFPTNPSSGDVCIVGTPGNTHIYCYLGGAWKQLDN